jgi:hypothetical protein
MNIDDEILQQPFCLAPDVSTGTKHYFKLKPKQLTPCLDASQKLKFFHSLSITSIFGPMHEVVNVDKK